MNEKLRQFKALITEWLQDASADDTEVTQLHAEMWDVLSSVLAEREAGLPPLSRISADNVRLVVKDNTTGRVFMRHLPLEYSESSNGVVLKGETFAAQPTKIVFLTEFALGKLLELQGKGQDEHVCDGHHSHDHDHHHHEFESDGDVACVPSDDCDSCADADCTHSGVGK
ncbi:MAG TPA: hypothetical protein GX728_03510 [Clostridiaceae bacterium]|nr:hypothetical protein [Clostridiaceae bacterium]